MIRGFCAHCVRSVCCPHGVQKALAAVNKKDPEIQKLEKKMHSLIANMKKEKNWITKVQQIVRHYQAKIGAVALGIRHEGVSYYDLKQLIKKRMEHNYHKLMTKKLQHVNKKLQVGFPFVPCGWTLT